MRYGLALGFAAIVALQLHAWDVESERAECVPGEPVSWLACFLVVAPIALAIAYITYRKTKTPGEGPGDVL